MAKEMVAMILAGGRGSRLYALTQKTAKPAVSFGGKYSIVDFPLSNCVNSNIDTVGIATQYQPQKLNEYIGNGQPWDLDRLYGGVHTLPPYEQAKGTDWYKGTANAIYQNISFIDGYDPQYVIILSGDQICKQDYADFLRFHKEKGAEFSVAVMEVPWEEAPRFGLMVADENDRITEFQEKPKQPKSNLASMGIYIFNWDILKQYLEADEADPNSQNDFGNNVIPALLRDKRKMYAYHFAGYWRDVGTIDSLWAANMEVLDPEHSGIDIFDESWKIFSRNPVMPCQKIGPRASVQDSLVTEGCKIYGRVIHSVLSAGVYVEEGATVEDAVIMEGTVVKAGAVVRRTIIADHCVVGAGAVVGGDGPIAHTASGLTIGAGATVKPGAKVYDSVKEGEEVC
jgi:glucose-1-phosphate adenylyltransferase